MSRKTIQKNLAYDSERQVYYAVLRREGRRYLRLNFQPTSAEAVRLVPERSWNPDADSVHIFSFEVE